MPSPSKSPATPFLKSALPHASSSLPVSGSRAYAFDASSNSPSRLPSSR
ncbi:MAG: hypothetical protein IPJ65_41445 [Archangiaceae bacterium]|nr:hypothetical protein [Archangiaceae bacterium]